MELILREDVANLGKAGDLVKVKDGFGRNFLLPQGLAYEATPGNKKRIEAESKSRLARHAAERAEVGPGKTRHAADVVARASARSEPGNYIGQGP